VFDRFRQGDSSTTKTSQGLGLGLSIVQHIVELHGGTVRAESPGEGQGTTMILHIPLAVPLPNDSALTIVTPIALATTEIPSLAGLRILVVDDEVDILDLIKHILEDVGAEVTIVTSARQAITTLLHEPDKYDALLADIGMPEEDGFALIHQVRAMEVGRQLPAMAITAYVGDREKQLAINAGFQMHLAKPLDANQLVQAVANLTGRLREE
jgi:two-component system CheB/CheR fusion protein